LLPVEAAMADAQARFQAFAEGRAEPRNAIIKRLAELGIDARPSLIRYGLLRKAVVELADGAGIVKFALHPVSANLLRNEAVAYAAPPPTGFDRASFRMLVDGGDWAAAWLSHQPGRVPSRWTALNRRAGPYETRAYGERKLEDHLDRLAGSARLEGWRRRVLALWSGETLAIGPSHGDFLYWNLLKSRGARHPTLLDFEYSAPDRSRAFDRCQWTLVPLLRQIGRRGWGMPPRWLARYLGVALFELAVAVMEHTSVIEEENRLPDIAALYGAEALARRAALLRGYDALMAGLPS
jgi:hypothetical protein